MTDLVQKIRARLDEVSAQRGKPLQLAVRVPPTLADSRSIGLNVDEWIETGLVDIVVVGGGFISFETPVDEFVRAAASTPCLVYGCIEATRHSDRRFLRALALRWLTDGADGIYLYNFYTMSPEWNRQTAAEFSDLETLKKLDKCYEISGTMSFSPTEGHGAAFRLANPSTQLPVPLPAESPSLGPTLRIRVADDVADATGGLALRLDHLPPEDRLEVELNGLRPSLGSSPSLRRRLVAPAGSTAVLGQLSYPSGRGKNGRGQRGICSGWFFFAAGDQRDRRAASGGAKRSPRASDADRRRIGYFSLTMLPAWQPQIENASTHEEIIAVLRSFGLDAIADRLNYLRQLVEDDPDEPSMAIESLRAMALFLMSERQLAAPQIGVTPDGLAQIEWRFPTNGILAMEFLSSGLIRFAAISAPAQRGVERLSVNGTLHKDAALEAVRPFTVRL